MALASDELATCMRLYAAATAEPKPPKMEQDRRRKIVAGILDVKRRTWAKDTNEGQLTAVYSKCNPRVVADVLRLLAPTAEDVIVDLGCGDGRWLVHGAATYGCKGVGYELDPDVIRDAHAAIAAEGVQSLVEIVQGDLFKAPLESATIIVSYLSKAANAALSQSLRSGLHPDARVVCVGFSLPMWPVYQDLTADVQFPVLIYKAGAPDRRSELNE